MSDISSGPFNRAVAIAPSDTVDQFPDGRPLYGLYVGGAGNVAVVLRDGSVVTFVAPAVGFVLPVIYKRINATNTTVLTANLIGMLET